LLSLGVNPQSIRGSKTGVFVSQCQSEAYVAWTDDVEHVSGYEMIGCILSMAANRLSYYFDFRGWCCMLFPHTHTHPFNGPFSGTTQVSRYQKGRPKTNLEFTEARDSEWQWHLLGHMQVCTLLGQITMPAPHHSVFTGRMPFLPPNQQRQGTEGNAIST